VVLNLVIPVTPVGLCPVVPTGIVNAPVAEVPTTPLNVPVVPDTAPLTAKAPTTVAPVEVTATIVVVPASNERLPEASAVVTTPPTPVTIAAIVDAIYIS
jgi:hypothetical protein